MGVSKSTYKKRDDGAVQSERATGIMKSLFAIALFTFASFCFLNLVADGFQRTRFMEDSETLKFDQNDLQKASTVTDLQPAGHKREKRIIGLIVAVGVGVAIGCAIFCGGSSPPPPQNGNWADWRPVGECSEPCGGGERKIVRDCNNPPPSHGGGPCEGLSEDYISCNSDHCPINGGWSSWTKQGVCSEFCGHGTQTLIRTCSNPPPQYRGVPCVGAERDQELCKIATCKGCFHPPVPDGAIYYSGPVEVTNTTEEPFPGNTSTTAVFEHEDVLSFGCHEGYRPETPPPEGSAFHTLMCNKGTWQGVSPVCNDVNECAEGLSTCDPFRSNCSNSKGSFNCFCKPGYEADENGECKAIVIHGGWGNWFPSGICTVTCGGGEQRYERRCDNPIPQNGGLPCSGDDFKYEPCNTNCCPVHGVWSDWIDGACSTTCGIGVHTRFRSCSGPFCGGRECTGETEVIVNCDLGSCSGCLVPVEVNGVLYNKGDKSEFQHGDELTYTCSRGYKSPMEDPMTFPSITCEAGVWQGDTPTCDDVDECAEGHVDCNPETSICQNTLGGFVCHCKTGYERKPGEHQCTDINECEDPSINHCQHECQNLFASFQCYCRAGYELQDDGISCVHPSTACSDLPIPGNGSVDCNPVPSGQRCTLTCDDGYIFSGSYDPSPQTCTDGVWRYEEEGQEIPDCVDIFGGAFLSMDVFAGDVGDCDTSTDFMVTDSVPDGDVSAECISDGRRRRRRRRALGRLRLKVTFSVRLPEGCTTLACIRAGYRILLQRERKLKNMIADPTSPPPISVSNSATNEEVPITLTSKSFKRTRPTFSCDPGTVLNGGSCAPCGLGYYYNTDGREPKCDPCPLDTFQDEEGKDHCKPCRRGTFTLAQGSKSEDKCLAPCSPGSFSTTGLEPCMPCPVGTYQEQAGAQLCTKCEFDQITDHVGAFHKEACSCPNGTYWQNCSKTCLCTNGGSCDVDGRCICPRSLTGPYCNITNTAAPCQDTYYITFLKNYLVKGNRHIFILTGSQTAEVDVGSQTDTQQIQIPPNNVANFALSPEAVDVLQFSIYPEDKTEIVGLNRENFSADMFSVFPVQQFFLKYEDYVAVSIGSSFRFWQRYGFNSSVIVVGTKINTALIVTPSQDGVAYLSSSAEPIKLYKGEKTTFEINRFETVRMSSYLDLTRSKLQASFPVAVYSGHECANVPVEYVNLCDHLVEQLPPVSVLGQCYVVPALQALDRQYLIKVVATEIDTLVSIRCFTNGDLTFRSTEVLNSDFKEYFIDPGQSCTVQSSKPVLVAQFAASISKEKRGGPFMIIHNDIEKMVNEQQVYSVENEEGDVEVFSHFITIIIPLEHFNPADIVIEDHLLLTMDYSRSSNINSDCGSFEVITIPVNAGHRVIKHNNPEGKFLVSAYGFAPVSSYGYSPGLNQALSCENKAKI